MGIIHPEVLKNYGINYATSFLELDFEALLKDWLNMLIKLCVKYCMKQSNLINTTFYNTEKSLKSPSNNFSLDSKTSETFSPSITKENSWKINTNNIYPTNPYIAPKFINPVVMAAKSINKDWSRLYSKRFLFNCFLSIFKRFFVKIFLNYLLSRDRWLRHHFVNY